MFYGEYRHTIDATGRVFIPAKLREKLGAEFMLARGFEKCICIYPNDEWERFTEKLSTLPMARDMKLIRYFNSGASDTTADAQGRVTVPQSLRDFAELGKDVVIVGNRTHLEVWSAENWAKEQASITAADVESALIELGF